jgi:aminopeptidase N
LTAKVLEFFTRYFGLEYPLPKLDLIGLGDIDIEAMENWGLITFKESLVLIDLDNYSVQTKFEVALTVSHEIAHQWFGNIVTMVKKIASFCFD